MVSNFLRGVISVISSRVGTMLLGVITTPILARLLGSTKYGEYGAIMSIFGLLIVISEFGVFDGMRKYIPDQREIEDWQSYVFGFYFRWSLAITTTVSVVLLLFGATDLGAIVFPNDYKLYFGLVSLSLFITGLNNALRGALMGLRLEHYSESLQLFKEIVFAVTAISLVYYGFEVAGAVLGMIIGTIFATLISLLVAKRHLNLKRIFQSTPSILSGRDLMLFNAQNAVNALFMVSLYHLDVLLLQSLIGGSQTGFYKAALNLAQFMWFVPTAVQFVLVQSVSEQWSAGNENQVSLMAASATRFTLVFSVLLAIGLAVLADIFVPLYYGTEFTPAILPLLLLLPGALGFAIARPIFAIGQGIGTIKYLTFATGIASAINFVLNLVLIPRYGMYGAAISTSIGYGSMIIFHTVAALKVGYNPIANIRILRLSLASFVLAVILITLRFALHSDLVAMIVIPPIGAVIYSITVISLNVISKGEIKNLIEGTPLEESSIETILTAIPSIVR